MAVLGKNKMSIGCFIIPDFMTCVSDTYLLADYLEMHGYCVGYPDMNKCNALSNHQCCSSYIDRIRFIEQEFQKFSECCDITVLIGFSMGGLIAAHLANEYSVDALVTLSTPIHHNDLKKLFEEQMCSCAADNGLNSISGYLRSLLKRPLPFSYQQWRFIRIMREKIRVLRCPILVIQGKKDEKIKWSSAYYIYEKAASREKEIQFFPKSGHEICRDCEHKLVFIRVHQFIDKIVGNKLLMEGHI